MKSKKKCHICQKGICYDKNEENKFKLYQKVRDHCLIQENLEELLKAFVI